MATTPSSLQGAMEVQASTIGDQAPTPASGSLTLFANQNGTWYAKNSAGVVTPLSGVTSVTNSDGTITITGTANAPVVSRAAITGDVAVSAGSNTATLATVATASTTGSAANTLTITIDAKGRVTSVTATPIQIAESQVTGLTTDLASKVSSVTGTAPIVSSGGATPAISISAATETAAGSMSAGDKLKIDNIWYDVTNYGVLPANADTVNLANWNTFYASVPVNSIVFFPPGTYSFSGELTLNRNVQVMIRGAGKSRSILQLTSATSNLFNLSISEYYYSFEELGFTSSVTKTAGSYITTNSSAGDNAYLDIRRCEMKKHFIGINLAGVGAGNVGTISECLINTPATGATGVIYNGSNINAMMTNCTINHGSGSSGTGICLQILQSGAIQFVGCDFIGGAQTLAVSPVTSTLVSALEFTNCYFDQASTNTIIFNGAGGVSRVKFSQCGITVGNVASANAVTIAGTGSGTAIPDSIDFFACDFYNAFAGLTCTGFVVTGCRAFSVRGSRISGFTNPFLITPYSAAGVTTFVIRDNIVGPTENFSANGTSVVVNAGSFAFGNYTITENDFTGNTTPTITDNGTTNGVKYTDNNLPLFNAGGLTAPVANFTIPATTTETQAAVFTANANTLRQGTVLRITLAGYFTTTAVGSNATFTIRIGTTTLTGAIAAKENVVLPATARTSANVIFTALLTVRSAGSSGTAIGSGAFSGNAIIGATLSAVAAIITPVTVNTTIANLIEVTYTGSTPITGAITSSCIEVVKS